MDKLEHYLDQVCWGIGGPRSLRQHIREELREHLQDAAAAHRTAGATEEEALARALEDFGGPEQVRSELEAAHGHRVIAVIVDKALQWKEITMRAKWVWMTWAHLALVGVIALEVLAVLSAMVFVVPKCTEILAEEWPDTAGPAMDEIVSWFHSVVGSVALAYSEWVWWVIPLAVLWVLFEWRCRSEHKAFIRLSALATAALGLMAVVILTAAAVALPLTIVAPTIRVRPPEPIVREQVANIDAALKVLDQALAARDWDAMALAANKACDGMQRLTHLGAAAATLRSLNQQSEVDELRGQLKAANESLSDAQRAIWNKDEGRLKAALQRVHAEYAPAESAATRPAQ
jgi:hypothetical protein